MKKLLIILLFLGFSFSQDKSDFIGTWKKLTVNQSYVFLDNNTGYHSFKSTTDLKSPQKFYWKIITSKTKGEGTLIIEYTGGVEQIFSFVLIPSEIITPEYIKEYIEPYGKWNGGDILIWWNSIIKQPKSFHIFEKF